MSALKVMTNAQLKKSNKAHLLKFQKRTERNTTKHFIKLKGGFENPKYNEAIKELTERLKKVNKRLEDVKKVKLNMVNSDPLRDPYRLEKLLLQDKINLTIQEDILKNVQNAFGESGLINSCITKEQMKAIESQRMLLSKRFGDLLNRTEYNSAIKDMTAVLNKAVNIYISHEMYTSDSSKNHFLMDTISIMFKSLEHKYKILDKSLKKK